VVPERINVREFPSGDSAWVRYAVKGEVLHVVNISDFWAQLSDGTYVLVENIRLAPASTQAPPTPVATATPVYTPTP